MNYTTQIITLLLGLTIGGAAIYVYMRSREQASIDRATSTASTEQAVLKTQLESTERERDTIKSELTESRSALANEQKSRATAEEKSSRIPTLETDLQNRALEINQLKDEVSSLRQDLKELETQLSMERESAAEKLQLLEQAKVELTNAFSALASEALRGNNESFLNLANEVMKTHRETAQGDLDLRKQAVDNLIAPINATLERVKLDLDNIERSRIETYSSLNQQIVSLTEGQMGLRKETGNLVKALRQPHARGRWGEIQLQRVVEMAGMVEYCDFTQQSSVQTADGRLRPDLVVRLPNGKNIIVDAKTPLQAFIDAHESADDDTRTNHLKVHARHVRTHMQQLSSKSYWEQFQPSPEFVVLFLPGETFYGAALEQDPQLIEWGVEQRVLIATPTTLIALLKAVSFGWRQERMAENAQRISDAGKELYDRVRTLTGHFTKVGKNLDSAVESYNSAIGSLESRVLVSARKFKDLGAAHGADIEEAQMLDRKTRAISARENGELNLEA